MAAKDALLAYGYVLDGDKYRMPRKGAPGWKSTQVWQETDDGWLRFEQDGGLDTPTAYMVSIAYQGVAGLDMAKQPQAFVWIWPEAEVERIYAAAVEAEGVRLAEAIARKASR